MKDETQEHQPEASVATFRVAPMEKADGPLSQVTVTSNVFEPEDEYHHYYAGATKSVNAIMPPYNLKTLDRLTQENNALGPCIEAMVTNVDGTGFTIVKDAPGAEEEDGDNKDPKALELWDFFLEPWPGESFLTQRKRLRRDIKRTGNGYLEIIRNAKDEILFTRVADSKMMRIIKLDEAISVPTTVKRRGQEMTVKLDRRYRRFVQLLNGRQIIYFKEFGCPRDLDKYTGKWAEEGKRIGHQKRATEVLHFMDLPDAHTPYGVPSWINQLPSVLGSRKAEEFNGEFFDNGGVPPVLIILQGGVLASDSRKAFEQRVTGPAAKKQRVNIIEMEPVGGTLDNPAQTKVVVERFGAERQQDSMFEKYDEKCEIRVRRSFRLPPIFVGQAQDYSFATAFASYTVAEAQVFRPERSDFDEVMNAKLIPAMGYPGYLMKSNPLSIEDVTLKLQGIEAAMATGAVENAEIVDAINETVGLSLKVSPQAPKLPTPPTPSEGGNEAMQAGKAGLTGSKRKGKPVDKGPKSTPTKSPTVTKDDGDFASLIKQAVDAYAEGDEDRIEASLEALRALSGDEARGLLGSLADGLAYASVSD